MTWEIKFGYDDPSDPLNLRALQIANQGPAGQELDDEERAVAERLVLDALVDPAMNTQGDLLAHLQRLGPEGRRARLNEIRAELGLPSTAKVDARRDMEARSRALAHLPGRDEA